MLEISTFKLIDGGRGGISIKAYEAIQLSKNYQVIDTITRERKLVLPDDLIERIQQLKYYFLNCTGHWMPPFNSYYDMTNHRVIDPVVDPATGKLKAGHEMLFNLWDKTTITGVSYKSGGFVLTGTIEAVEGKKTVINTPFITEEDDLGFFSTAVDKIGDCVHEIVNYFVTKELPVYKPEAILTEEERKGLNMEELTNLMVEKLVDRNMIMLVKDEGDNTPALSENTDTKTTLSKNTKNIDSENLSHVETLDDDEESPADKAVRMNLAGNQKDAFGKPASENEFPEELRSKDSVSPKDLASLEHSEAMGLGGEEQSEKEKEEWAE